MMLHPSLNSLVQPRTAIGRIGLALVLGALYLAGALISLWAPLVPGRIALIWIPTGIAFGFVALSGLWLLPVVFLAGVVANLAVARPLSVTLVFAAANTLSLAVAVAVLRRDPTFSPDLKRARDVARFAVAAVVGGSAGGFTASLVALGSGAREMLPIVGLWSLAETLSMVALSPVYFTFLSKSRGPAVPWPWARRVEFTAQSTLMALFAYLVFLLPRENLGFFSRVVILLPLLLWAALRFNPRVMSIYLKGLAVAAVLGAALGRGAFASGELSLNLVEVQIYMGIFCVSSLLIAAISYERARLARERENELRLLANAIPELVWTTDRAGNNNYWNQQARAYFGAAAGHAAEEVFQTIIHPDDQEKSRHAWQHCVTTGEPFALEQRLRRHDGTYQWFLSKASPVRDPDGTIRQWIGASMNVEAQRRAIAQLEEEKDIRDRMVFTLSHDIRNPLAVIDAGAQVLLKAPAPPELARNFLEQISASVQRANRMIVDLLDANRLRAGRLPPLKLEETDLVYLHREVIRSLSTVHGEVFRLEAPAEIEGYWAAEEIRRITENLCQNAVKYGDPSRGVVVSLRKPGGAADEVCIVVHNHGSLIPDYERAQIFGLFHRTRDCQGDERKGWGIGLFLVRGLALAHGGRVEVKSSAAEGTIFTVTLPRDARSFVREKNSAPV